MILINEHKYDNKFNLINMLHDALIWMPKVEDLKEMLGVVIPIMERKSKVLKNDLMPEGFWCKVDGEVGKNMASMEKI